ncbi:MAG: EpsI family protein [Myxococcota bacterium]|nr:EpsI family protein [Myxococcota bacterium]
MLRLTLALILVALNFYTYRFFAKDEVFPERAEFVHFPMNVGEWNCSEAQEMGKDVLSALDVTDYLLCDFTNEEDQSRVNVYVGYHASQTRDTGGDDNIIHPPEHCIPGSGWDIIQSEIVPLQSGVEGEAKRMIIAKGNMRNLVYFWYQSRGRTIARDHEKVLYMFLDRAVSGRTDGSLVRFTIPIIHGNEAEAQATFDSIAQQVTPLLHDFIPN